MVNGGKPFYIYIQTFFNDDYGFSCDTKQTISLKNRENIVAIMWFKKMLTQIKFIGCPQKKKNKMAYS